MNGDELRLTGTQLVNYTLLSTIRAALAEDALAARSNFQLSAEQAQRITNLDAAQVLLLVGQLKHASLFVPRANLVHLLAVPPGLLPLLTSAPRAQPPYRVPVRSVGRRRTDAVIAEDAP